MSYKYDQDLGGVMRRKSIYAENIYLNGQQLLNANTPGKVIYVDKNKDGGSGNGSSWSEAFLTITEAIADADDYDVIYISHGVYSEAATLNITQTGLKIFGSGTSGFIWGPTSLKSDTCKDHLITVNANEVEIAGLDFICNTDEKDAIRVATTKDIYKLHIHDCHFGLGTGEYGVYTGATYDSVDMHIDRCEFYNAMTCGVRMNGTRNKVTNCLFFVPASGIGIEYVPNAEDRPDSFIGHNRFIGSNSSDTGIKITGSPTAGTYLITDNFVANCATTITGYAGNDACCVLNYTGSAAGGALIDPSP